MRFDSQQPALMRRFLFASASTLFLITVGSQAFADEFYLASGKVVRGAVVAETTTEYSLKTEMGTIKVSKADVTRTVSVGTTAAEVEGDIAAARGDFENAVTLYRQAAAQAPSASMAAGRLGDKIAKLTSATRQAAAGNLVAQYNQAQELLRTRNYEAAEVMLDKLESQVSSADPMSSEILKMQAQLHYGKGMAAADAVKLEVARQAFQDAIAADATYYPAYLDLGKSLLSNSNTVTQGIQFIEQGLAIAGDRLPEQERFSYQYTLAGKYFDQGNYSKAAAAYADIISARDRYPAYADALDKAVNSYVKMGEESLSSDFQETIANLNEALQLNPKNEKALFLLGRIYLDNGQVENAVIVLKKLVDQTPNYPEANHYLGRAYFRSRDYDLALSHLTTEIRAHSDNYFALVDRAEVYIATGDYAAAESDLTAARALDPENWYAYYLSGLKSFRQQNYPEARTALMEALEHRPKAMPIHLLMGRVLVQQNEAVAARQWFEQVAASLESVDGLSYRFRIYLAESYTYLSQISKVERSPRQALNYAEKAVNIASDYGPAIVALADAKVLLAEDPAMDKKKLYDEAEALYTRAIKGDPENPEFYLKLGSFYHRYDVDHDKARTNFNLYADKGGTDAQVNAWLVEVGGTARTELQPKMPPPTTMFGQTTTATASTTATAVLPGTDLGGVPTTATMPGAAPMMPVPGQVTPGTAPTMPMPMAPVPAANPMSAPGAVPGMPQPQNAPAVPATIPMNQTVPITTTTTPTQ